MSRRIFRSQNQKQLSRLFNKRTRNVFIWRWRIDVFALHILWATSLVIHCKSWEKIVLQWRYKKEEASLLLWHSSAPLTMLRGPGLYQCFVRNRRPWDFLQFPYPSSGQSPLGAHKALSSILLLLTIFRYALCLFLLGVYRLSNWRRLW